MSYEAIYLDAAGGELSQSNVFHDEHLTFDPKKTLEMR
jgi:hypothetical protein